MAIGDLMSEIELVAPCGINCARCSAYLAYKHDAKGKGVAMYCCEGCRPKRKKCGHLMKDCSLLRRGQVRFCYECGDFPCAKLRLIDERYRKSYRMSLLENLELIKRSGVEGFLAKEREAWSCGCGELRSCHNGLCFACDLEELKRRKKRDVNRWM